MELAHKVRLTRNFTLTLTLNLNPYSRRGVSATTIHGDREQWEREAALRDFKDQKTLNLILALTLILTLIEFRGSEGTCPCCDRRGCTWPRHSPRRARGEL